MKLSGKNDSSYFGSFLLSAIDKMTLLKLPGDRLTRTKNAKEYKLTRKEFACRADGMNFPQHHSVHKNRRM
jgi:hypothetical protein